MTVQLLVNIAADDPQLVASLNGSLPEAIHVLAADALKAAFQRTPFKIQSDVTYSPEAPTTDSASGLLQNTHDLIGRIQLQAKF